MQKSTATSPTIVPTIRYRDAAAAIDWLCDAFGFARHLVVPDGNGGITHAQLTLGNGMIMIGSARDDEFGQVQRPVESETATVTQSAYIIIDDVDEHYARAKACGAKIFAEPRDEAHGGRFYSCRDPQGQFWNFGSYDPWASSEKA